MYHPLRRLGPAHNCRGSSGNQQVRRRSDCFAGDGMAARFGDCTVRRRNGPWGVRVPSCSASHSNALGNALAASQRSGDERFDYTETLLGGARDQGPTIYLAIGLVIRAKPVLLISYGFVTLWNFFSHMNVRAGFGPVWFLLNSPQCHRFHHSVQPEHHDKNFAGFFTFFDAIFGTASIPRLPESPVTGLSDGDRASGLAKAIIWPARGWTRRLGSKQSVMTH